MTTSATTVAAEGTGLREQKRLATRRALADATLQLSAEVGFGNVTVEQICAEAGVSRRTFFNYFPSKDDAIMRRNEDDIPSDLVAEFVAAGAGRPRGAHGLTDTLVDDLVTLTTSAAERSDFDGERFALMIKAIEADPRLLVMLHESGDQLTAVYADVISRREGVPSDSPHVRALVSVVTAMAQLALAEFFRPDNTRTFTEIHTGKVALVRDLFSA